VASAVATYAGPGRKMTGEETNLPVASWKIDDPAQNASIKKPTG
jgi:hypothetical protein